MERRALLAASLCLIVLIGYQEVLRYLYPTPPEGVSSPSELRPPEPPVPEPAMEALPARPPVETAPIDHGEPIRVDTDLMSAEISPVGGRITSLKLKKFRTAVTAESEPLEMIQVGSGTAAPLGIRLASDDGKLVEDDTQVVYTSDRNEVSAHGLETDAVVLRGTLPSGATIEKKLTFPGASYPIEVEVRTSGAAAKLSRLGVGWRHQIGEAIQGDPEAHYRGSLVLEDKKVARELATSIAASPPKTFNLPSAGWDTRTTTLSPR